MFWKIEGIDLSTDTAVELTLEAATQAEAERFARYSDVRIASARPVQPVRSARRLTIRLEPNDDRIDRACRRPV
jgi:hypothetical protein